MEKGDQSRIKLQLALEKAINMLDLRVPYSDSFYESIRACNAFVKEEIYQKLAGEDSVIATCIGHTHIDVLGGGPLSRPERRSCVRLRRF